ncbi:DEAD/DEAH box helicase family protein [Nitrosomonas sp.]|uniref:DEAD/DEAH box helicase family protein n=1 Tax=Nitrosomonas sp. TaxID=42353 RepID=UPI002601DC37|nr:DEAD/DEAH box helicase family protein [Nitrosomonas sp.]MCW5601780.1 DEAD/DEAH box helicase family protein [Nitrosomonas sp.]
MAAKEAKARIKINKLLEEAGWRFLDGANGKANIVLEPNVKLTKAGIDAMGENFESAHNGFIDFLLLDAQSHPLIVLEAKAEDKNPLIGKEQARSYAQSQRCRFVILSNGNLHYFWDLEQGNPHIIMRFPNPDSIKQYQRFQPNPRRLITELVAKDYIALTQMPGYTNEAGWKNEIGRPEFIAKNRLRFLRDYQKRAVHAIQDAVAEGKSRFLFEMATGTGKTLTAAAVIKLFLRTGNAQRVLFLVDRLELEDQANKAFVAYLKNDYTAMIYKARRDEWRSAEIVVTTVQSLLFNDKYQRLFSPTDFDLVISDEAHRSIGGNARAVFEYFVGYKLGLTATPKDYLKQFDSSKTNTRDPRELERRLLLDTYRTFGCETGEPTFRYSLLAGVRDGFLINPVVVDARSDITTQLLSDKGYAVAVMDNDGNEASESFYQKDFEKKFFSEATNRLFCETFMRNALCDPISGETGKSIVFAVSQNHAARLTQILNELADAHFPGKYQSDFAVQVTSLIPEAQQYTINFANNNLLGSANFEENYRTSKARVCVTVGMMTTGYDCPDILNLAMMRPIFSPQDFIQIKGRGTRKHDFLEQLFDPDLKRRLGKQEKSRFKLFDFFANCEYFEEKFNYDEVLQLPQPGKGGEKPVLPPPPPIGLFLYGGVDKLASLGEHEIGEQGMKIDRMLFKKFEEKAQQDTALKTLIDNEQWDQAADYVQRQLFDKPADFFTLEGLRRAVGMDRRLNMRELLEKVFGLIPKFKSKGNYSLHTL